MSRSTDAAPEACAANTATEVHGAKVCETLRCFGENLIRSKIEIQTCATNTEISLEMRLLISNSNAQTQSPDFRACISLQYIYLEHQYAAASASF
jgi:hypothetical protein